MDRIRGSIFHSYQLLTRRHKQFLIWLADLVVAPVAFLMACIFTYASPWPAEHLVRLAMMFPMIALMAGIASVSLGLPWIKLKSYESFGSGPLALYAALVGGGVFLLTSLPGLEFPLVGTLSFTLLLFLADFGARVVMLATLNWVLRFRKPCVRVLIYGAGSTGLQLATALRIHESISVVAFIDDDPALKRERLAGLRIYPPSQIAELVQNHDVSRVILAIPSLSAPKQAQLGRWLQGFGLEVQVLPSFAQLVGAEALVDRLTMLSPGNFLGRAMLDDSLPGSGDTYRGKSVLVSGAGGSIGSELCRQLLQNAPRRLVLFESSEHALYLIERELRELQLAPATELAAVLGSVTDARATRQVLEDHDVDIVFHAAAYKHVPLVEDNPLAGLNNNVMGTRTIADACVRHGVKRFVLISSDKAVRPTNVMGASKRLAERVVQDMAKRNPQTQFSIVRFGNVLGSSGSVIPLFKEQIARGGPVTLTHDDVTRYFMTIPEAVQLVLTAGALQEEGLWARADVFVLDMGRPVRIRQLAEQMIQAAGYTVRSPANPNGDIEIKVIGLRPGEKLHEELLIGEGMSRTPHPKILRAAEESSGGPSISAALQELARMIATGDAAGARKLAFDLACPDGKETAAPEQDTVRAV